MRPSSPLNAHDDNQSEEMGASHVERLSEMLLKLMVVGTHWSLQSTCFVTACAKLAPGGCKQDQDPHLQGNILNTPWSQRKQVTSQSQL